MNHPTTYPINPNPNKYRHSLRLLHQLSKTKVEYSYFKDFCIYGKGMPNKRFLDADQYVRIKVARAQGMPIEYYVTDEARTMIMFRFCKEDERIEQMPRPKKSISQMKYWSNKQGLYP